jgi:hypothetical protein
MVTASDDPSFCTKALYDEAKQKGWTVISMKNDWKRRSLQARFRTELTDACPGATHIS